MGNPDPKAEPDKSPLITLPCILKQTGPPCVVLIIFVLAFFLLGSEWMLPGKPGFSLYCCWVAGLAGGRLMSICRQPPLLGMLIAGILLRNVGKPSLVDALPNAWGSAVRVFGLSVILMRSGLELDLGAIARIGAACVRLTVCPGCSEALMVGLAAFVVFGMPVSLALSLGFILAAVSPAVVVGGMFDLQRRGFGLAKGIPSLVVAAASFDDVVAITGYSLCIGFAISTGHSNVLWEALHGPINVGLGLSLGFLGGYFVAISDMWDTPVKRTIIVALTGLTFAYACSSIHFTGAGALASLVTTCVAARRWGQMAAHESVDKVNVGEKGHGGENDGISEESTAEPGEDASPKRWASHVEHHLAVVWNLLAQPLLFCVIGSALDFSQLDAGTIPMSVIVILCGVSVRCPVAGFVLFGTKLTKQERTFVGLAWIPKATVQAALGGIPLDIVRTSIDPHHDPQLFAKYEKWGLQILTTAVLSILITAPIGLLVIQNLGHRWLNNDLETKSSCDAQTKGLTAVDEEGAQSRLHSRRNTMEMQAEILKEFRVCDPESGEDKAVNVEDIYLEDLPSKDQLKEQEEGISGVQEDSSESALPPKKEHSPFEALGSLFSLKAICGGVSSRE